MEQKQTPKWNRKLRKCKTCYERRHYPISDAGEWVPIQDDFLQQRNFVRTFQPRFARLVENGDERDYSNGKFILDYLGECQERELFIKFAEMWPSAYYYLTVERDEIVFENGELGDLLVTITFDARPSEAEK